MIAATIADGTAYRELAELAAESVRKHTSLETVVLSPSELPGKLRHPAYAKLLLLRQFTGESILYFDADTRFVRDWDVSALADIDHFAAVADLPSKAKEIDCKRYKLDPVWYVNCGLWIASQRHAAALEAALHLANDPAYWTAFRYEQTALNVALQRHRVPIRLLDPRYNWICATNHPPPPDVTVLHIAGGSLQSRNRAVFERALRSFNRDPTGSAITQEQPCHPQHPTANS